MQVRYQTNATKENSMTSSVRKSDKFLRRLEKQEAEYWSDHYRDVPKALMSWLSIGLLDWGSVKAGAIASIDTLAFNRVIGLGTEKPGDEKQVGEIINFYRDAGVDRFFVQLSPAAKPARLPDILQSMGFHHYNNWVKLARPVSPVPVAESRFDIEQIGPERAETFAEIIVSVFQWSEQLKTIVALPVGRPGWKHYLVYAGGRAVACAALFILDEYASLAFAATLPAFRGRGAQSALIARRFRDAREAGCHWMIIETAEETPFKPVASFRNMIRLGFELAYTRPNYLFVTS